ncbi:MAG: FHA domain-containing protein [Planctomycetes bacterium]|nr:FHA domain-containing protein [Planctomycetota bacterium]
MAELVVSAPDGTVARYNLGNMMSIGRHPECEVVLTDPMSSRRHCKIEKVGAQFFVEDNNSANGTILNGEPLKSRRQYNPGDTIQIGLTKLLYSDSERPGVKAGAFDPTLSVVSLREDLNEAAPNFDFTMAAGGGAVSADEEATSDLTQLKRVTQRLKILLDLGQSLGSTLVPRKVLQTGLDKLFFEVFPQAERGFILLYGPNGELPSSILTENPGNDALEGRKGPLSVSRVRNAAAGEEGQVKVSSTIVNRVRTQRQAVLVSDAASDAAYNPAMSMARLEIRSVMCAPLVIGSEDLGIIYIDTKDNTRRFAPDDLNLLNAVAGTLAVVIKNAELARHAAAEAATRENLQRFLSPHLVDLIIKKEMTVDLGGSIKKGTVFFSDIVGFTRMAGKMRPADVVTLLNRYFRVMQEIIFSRGGTVDKFGGDQIMAFWGVLVETPQAAAAACTAAVEMQNAMLVFNRELARDESIVKPPAPLGHGIGLNTGEFVAGNIGSERKIEFTVIGNSVNLAQRLEATAGRGQVFVGQGTYDAIAGRALVFRMPETSVKNVDEAISIFSIRGIIPPMGKESADLVGMTARVEPSAEQMIFSLPCVLTVDGQPDVTGMVVRASFDAAKKSGVFQLLTDRPLPRTTAVKLQWRLPEKPSLPALTAVVEKSWVPEPKAPGSSSVMPSPIDAATRPAPPPHEHQAALDTLVLNASNVPPEILEFKPNTLIKSDLQSADQIVRA